MKNRLLLLCIAATVCGCGSRRSSLEGDPVAERVIVDGIEVISADVSAFTSSVTIPLSELAGPLEIVRLETRNEALFSYGKVYLTDNYIGILTSAPTTFKLFDRKGKYLRDIGHEGRGPGEYGNIYSAAIDEASQTIYIMPWSAEVLLAFGIDGTIKEPVKLAHRAAKGVFKVNPDGTFSVAVVPAFGSSPSWVWTQDREGNIIHEVPVPDGRRMDFSSEIFAYMNTGEFDPFLMMFGNTDSDYLANYDPRTGKMIPLFTIHNIQSKKPPFYYYAQLPGHIIGMYAPGMDETLTDADGNTMTNSLPPVNFIIDKKTLRGAEYNVVVDEFGGLAAGNTFSQGYYIGNWAAIRLKSSLEELIASGTIEDPAVMKRVTDLNDSFKEDDNNLIFIAPLKK